MKDNLTFKPSPSDTPADKKSAACTGNVTPSDESLNVRLNNKRKKYRFARFKELENCFEAVEWNHDRRIDFARDGPLVVELGAGTALFSVELAARWPYKRFLCIDVKADRLQKGAAEARAKKLDNIVFVRAHAAQLFEVLEKASIGELWLTFADPFPKKRHAKHRMTHRDFLEIYRELLVPAGVFHFKTDNLAFFQWSLESFVQAGLYVRFLTFNLHDSDAPQDYKIVTSFEEKFLAEGMQICEADMLF